MRLGPACVVLGGSFLVSVERTWLVEASAAHTAFFSKEVLACLAIGSVGLQHKGDEKCGQFFFFFI